MGTDTAETRVRIDYAPRAIWGDWHQNRTRESCIVAHRRAGKTVAVVNELIRSALTVQERNPRCAYIGPTYSQAKRIAWDYAKHYSRQIPGATVNEAELRIDYPNGGRLQLLGQDNPDSLRGAYYDDVACDEFQMWRPGVFGEILRPALADRRGRAVFLGTPAGTENPLHEAYQRIEQDGGYTRVHRASDTKLIPQEELDAAKRSMSDEQYAAEFECSWSSSIIGSIYGVALDEMDKGGRICRIPMEPGVPVDISWDLGRGDSTALWFWQRVGPETRAIDHYEANGYDLSHYTEILEQRRRDNGYHYGTLLLPHDARHRHMTGESVETTLNALRYHTHVCPKGDPKQEIHAVRQMFRTTWLERERCDYGIKCLRNYRYRYNEDRKTFYADPLHDWTSHSADAVRVYAVNRNQVVSQSWGAPMKKPRLSIA